MKPSFTSFSMASLSSLNSYDSCCETLFVKYNIWSLSQFLLSVFLFLRMGHFAVLCMSHNFFVESQMF